MRGQHLAPSQPLLLLVGQKRQVRKHRRVRKDSRLGGGKEGGHMEVGYQAAWESSQNKHLERKGITFPDSVFIGMWSVCFQASSPWGRKTEREGTSLQ